MAKRQPKSRAGRADTSKTPRKTTKSKGTARQRKSQPVVVFAKEAANEPPTGPSPEALEVYERGMEALQRHQHQAALEAFSLLLENFPAQPALLDRARIYLELCRRALATDPTEPQTAEEKVTAATAALNNDDHARAEELAKSALGDAPGNDVALYLLATIEVRRGREEAALAYLADAVAITPEAGAQAGQDADFASLRDREAFRKLTRPPESNGDGRSR